MRRTAVRLSTLPPNLRTILASRSQSIPSSSASAPTSDNQQDANNEVIVNGWIRSIRSHKNVAFAEVHDGSSSRGVQAVLKGKGKADGLTNGTSVQLKGRLTKSKGQGQDVELLVEDVRTLGECDPEAYPIQKKSLPASVLRDNAHLRFRTSQTAATMRVRDALMRDWHDWFEENGFTHIHTPILTGSDCEGAGEVFTICDPTSSSSSSSSTSTSTSSSTSSPSSSTYTAPQNNKAPPFFPHPVHLTVSGQLHLEAPTHALSRVYTLSPAFRAEPSLTSRHLSEFYMLEGEVAFVETLDQLLDLVEDGVKNTVAGILAGGENGSKRGERIRADLEVIAKSLAESESSGSGAVEVSDQSTLSRSDPLSHLRQVISKPFTRITYTAALDLLAEVYGKEKPFEQVPPKWGEGIATEHEKWLALHFGGPVFVTQYPASLKPFYMLPSPSSSSSRTPTADSSTALTHPSSPNTDVNSRQTVECFDLLFPQIGEMAGGSLREHRLDNLTKAIEGAGMDKKDYEWYMDLRRYGSVPHGGWGMGWERWVCWVTGVGNVRDVVGFARWKGHCKY
ncbi:hypothetical protein IAT40_003728 [Kwoniella sp. CBS 6097]